MDSIGLIKYKAQTTRLHQFWLRCSYFSLSLNRSLLFLQWMEAFVFGRANIHIWDCILMLDVLQHIDEHRFLVTEILIHIHSNNNKRYYPEYFGNCTISQDYSDAVNKITPLPLAQHTHNTQKQSERNRYDEGDVTYFSIKPTQWKCIDDIIDAHICALCAHGKAEPQYVWSVFAGKWCNAYDVCTLIHQSISFCSFSIHLFQSEMNNRWIFWNIN